MEKLESVKDRVWDISCTKDIFDTLRTDEKFLDLLTLARLLNALRFCQQSVIDVRNSDRPSASRQRVNSFLFASSVLFEGFKLAGKLGEYFRDFESYRNGFEVLLKDRKIKNLRAKELKKIRNKVVFHFERGVLTEVLKDFDPQNYRFVSSFGRTSGELHYGLADVAVMKYLFQQQPGETEEALNKRFLALLEDITELMGKFTEAAELLIAEALVPMGWTKEIRE